MSGGMVTGVEAEGERESYPASRPEPFPRGERHHVVYGRRTREQHHEPINAERDPHRLHIKQPELQTSAESRLIHRHRNRAARVLNMHEPKRS